MNHPALRAAFSWCVLVSVALAGSVRAEGPPDTAQLLAAQRQALLPLAAFDGLWRGPAKVTTPDGRQIEIVQTERVGPLLDNTLHTIEGRGYGADGTLMFNAFAVISFAPQDQQFHFHSYAQGYAGDFPLEVGANGFAWSIKAGPATLRYVATVADGVWTEVGERLVEGRPPQRIFEMSLKRIGATDWPAAGALQPN